MSVVNAIIKQNISDAAAIFPKKFRSEKKNSKNDEIKPNSFFKFIKWNQIRSDRISQNYGTSTLWLQRIL